MDKLHRSAGGVIKKTKKQQSICAGIRRELPKDKWTNNKEEKIKQKMSSLKFTYKIYFTRLKIIWNGIHMPL